MIIKRMARTHDDAYHEHEENDYGNNYGNDYDDIIIIIKVNYL